MTDVVATLELKTIIDASTGETVHIVPKQAEEKTFLKTFNATARFSGINSEDTIESKIPTGEITVDGDVVHVENKTGEVVPELETVTFASAREGVVDVQASIERGPYLQPLKIVDAPTSFIQIQAITTFGQYTFMVVKATNTYIGRYDNEKYEEGVVNVYDSSDLPTGWKNFVNVYSTLDAVFISCTSGSGSYNQLIWTEEDGFKEWLPSINTRSPDTKTVGRLNSSITYTVGITSAILSRVEGKGITKYSAAQFNGSTYTTGTAVGAASEDIIYVGGPSGICKYTVSTGVWSDEVASGSDWTSVYSMTSGSEDVWFLANNGSDVYTIRSQAQSWGSVGFPLTIDTETGSPNVYPTGILYNPVDKHYYVAARYVDTDTKKYAALYRYRANNVWDIMMTSPLATQIDQNQRIFTPMTYTSFGSIWVGYDNKTLLFYQNFPANVSHTRVLVKGPYTTETKPPSGNKLSTGAIAGISAGIVVLVIVVIVGILASLGKL